MEIGKGDVLLLVDVQNDFLPGGALAVPGGDEVIAPLNQAIFVFSEHGQPIFASRDWHPKDHCSFRENGGEWPSHCVAGNPGAAFASSLELPCQTVIVSKGTDTDCDSYSAFSGTDLGVRLASLAARRLFVGGLATDYCVRATVIDGLAAGFEVLVILDGCRPVEVNPGDGERSLTAMDAAGAAFVKSGELR